MVVYCNEFTEEVELCGKDAKWQGENNGFACYEHKDCLVGSIRSVEELDEDK